MKIDPEQRPDEAFEDFLIEHIQKGWLKTFAWLGSKPKKGLELSASRSHKNDEHRKQWLIEIESASGFRSGVDLEYLVEGRPLFQNPDWLQRRFKIPSATLRALSATELLEEWSYREAAFKALYPYNEGVLLSDFQRPSPSEMIFQGGAEELRFSLAGAWRGPWFLALARRRL